MTSLKTTTEETGKDRVKLTVEVPEKALEPAIAAAYKRWAGQIKVPGFRKGKVPRQLVDARVGPGVVREDALREALPDLYREALQAEALEAIAPPDIEVTQFEAGSDLIFEAVVDLRPEVKLPDLSAITVQAPDASVTDEDVKEQIDRLRDRFAELETVSRPARDGDHVLIDLKGYLNEELIEGASAPDYLYELGSRSGPPRLDEELRGEKAGAILKFTDTIPDNGSELAGRQVSFTVLVKETKAKKLPDADDAFAGTVGGFESIAELEEDLRTRLAEHKAGLVEEEIRGKALEALIDAADVEAPEKLVDSEVEHRIHHVEEDLKKAGMTFDQYAEASGSTALEIRSDIRTQAARGVKAELLLEEIARANDVTVEEEDIGREIAFAAAQAQKDPKEVAEQLVAEGRLNALAANIMRRKALDHVVQNIQVEGRVEPAAPETEEGERDD